MCSNHKTIEDQIYFLLTEALAPISLSIENESHNHAGHAGDNGTGQTHFKLRVVSDSFVDSTRVQQHRMVNDILKPLFEQGLHALQLECSAP